MPKSLHTRLTAQAEREGVSLNMLVVAAAAQALGQRVAREMHDTVIQGCVGVSTLLEAAARFRDLDAAEAEALLD